MTPRQSKPQSTFNRTDSTTTESCGHTPTKKFSPIYPFTKNVGAFTISLSTIKLHTIYLKVVTSGHFHDSIRSYNFSAPTQAKAPPFEWGNRADLAL
jgi:hypothetical protein